MQQWGGDKNGYTPTMSPPLLSESEISDKNTDQNIWMTVSLLPALVPTSCEQASPGTHTQLFSMGPGQEWVVAAELRTEID